MKKEPTLDLHGYRVNDVVDAVDRFLVKSMKAGHSRIRIMTGKGTGQVRKAVADYLRLGGYPFQAEVLPSGARNDGVLVVFIGD